MSRLSIIFICIAFLFSACKTKNRDYGGGNADTGSQNLGIQSYNHHLKVILIAEHGLKLEKGLNLTGSGSDNDLLTILIPSLIGVAIVGGVGAYTFKRFLNRQSSTGFGNSDPNLKPQITKGSSGDSSFNPRENLQQIEAAVKSGDEQSALLKHRELDDIYRNIQTGRLGIQTINSKMDLLSYSDLVDDPALIAKSLDESEEAFIVYNPSMSDIPTKLEKYYDIDWKPEVIPNYLKDYEWQVIKIKRNPTPPPRELSPGEIELFSKIDAGEPVRGSFSNLMWTHNMPSDTFLNILDRPVKLKNLGARGLQFRYGLDSQYGDISFVLKNRPLSYWHSKPGKGVANQGITEVDNAVFMDHWNKKQILETELPRYLKEEANNYGFLGEGRTREAEHYHNASGACVSKSAGRPAWCNMQMQLNTDIGPKDIAAVILPGFLRSETARIQKQLPGVDLLFVDSVPSKAYHDYYLEPREGLEDLVNSGSIEEAVQNGVMRSPFVEGNSSTVSLSKQAFTEAQKVYMKYISKHADQFDSEEKLLAGTSYVDHFPTPFNGKEIAKLKEYYDVPYTGGVRSPDDIYPNRKGLARANHGLAHAFRQGAIATDIVNILKKYGGDDHKLSNWIRAKSASDPFFEKKIEMAAVYQRSGRTDESSPSNAIFNYAPQAKASADNFRKAAKESWLFTEQEIVMFERAIMRDEILKYHQSEQLLHLRKNPSENPELLIQLESIAGKTVNGKEISNQELEGFVKNLDDRGGPLTGDEIMIDHIIHASHMADLRRLNRSWNTPELIPNEIAKNLGLRMDIPLDKQLVEQIYKRTGKYLKATGAPDSAKYVDTESGYQDLDLFIRQANMPERLIRAIDSVRTTRFTFEPRL